MRVADIADAGVVWPGFARREGTVAPVAPGWRDAPAAARAGGAAWADSEPARGPGFDRAVRPGGYAWWYVDALSDDGQHGLTMIAFIGSVFSPYYAWARRRGGGVADPANHCALNVALYGTGGRRWAMTERGRDALRRDATWLTIGPSALLWDGTSLTIQINEITAPLPGRLRGQVRVHPAALGTTAFTLDAAGRHRWWPIAPCARVEVALQRPGLTWSGAGYLDSNDGDEPLEAAFARWDWSRAALRGGTAILYDVSRRDGSRAAMALRADTAGRVTPEPVPPPAPLRRSFWRVARGTRADAGTVPAVRQTLEDGPFYARSVVSARVLGEDVTAMHESLSLDRFRRLGVQVLLPVRMPRALR